MNKSEFQNFLQECINYALANEHDLIFEFLNVYAGCEIQRFYMADDLCEVVLIDFETGQHFATTIDTSDFLDWMGKNENNPSA